MVMGILRQSRRDRDRSSHPLLALSPPLLLMYSTYSIELLLLLLHISSKGIAMSSSNSNTVRLRLTLLGTELDGCVSSHEPCPG